MPLVIAITLHIAFLLGMLLLFVTMFTQHRPGKGAALQTSWILLKLTMISTICLHLVAIGVNNHSTAYAFAFDVAVWVLNFFVFIWARCIHHFPFFSALVKELNRLHL